MAEGFGQLLLHLLALAGGIFPKEEKTRSEDEEEAAAAEGGAPPNKRVMMLGRQVKQTPPPPPVHIPAGNPRNGSESDEDMPELYEDTSSEDEGGADDSEEPRQR